MTTVTNTGTGRLILPDGRGLEPGESAAVDAAALSNVVVASWVADGLLAVVEASPVEAVVEPQPEAELAIPAEIIEAIPEAPKPPPLKPHRKGSRK